MPDLEDRAKELRAEKEKLMREAMEMDEESKEPVQSNLFNYADGSSSEEDAGKREITPYYNDLEELD